MSRGLTGVSNQRYRKLFRGKREKLVAAHEGEKTDAGKLARLVRQLEEAVVSADKDGVYYDRCPICGAGAANPSTSHLLDCTWSETVRKLRGS